MGSWPWLPLVALALVLLCLQVSQVDGSIKTYRNAQFSKRDNSGAKIAYGGSEGLYRSKTKGAAPGVANGKSYIRLPKKLVFKRKEEVASKQNEDAAFSGFVQALIYDVDDLDKIGRRAFGDGKLYLCCSPDLAMTIDCKVGQVIVSSGETGPKLISIYFTSNHTQAYLDKEEEYEITKTGFYTLYFVSCDRTLDYLAVDGQTIWKNPSGYLPGRMAPFMTFYGFMSLAYVLLGVIWLFQYVRFWKDILQLQNCITVVIALGMCEMAMWYFEYVNFNSTGNRPVGITLWAVTLGAVKKTVSRLLILVVSMGYGVVRPTLGGLTSKVIVLGGTYFLAAESLDVVENVGTINDFSGKARLFLVLPVAILDAFFILWIFTSLSRTLEKLQARRSYAKLELYRKFTNSLAVAVVIAVAWIGYELYFQATDPLSKRWRSAWIISAFWNILTFVLVCIICALWSPSQNSTRYAFSEDAGEDFDDEESIALAPTNTGKSEVEKVPKVEKKDKKSVNTDVFSLEDEPEEDKRE
eukprot:TRINITY_DN2523_c0_g1_i1.p1 TRINITY_DN2523_c0_g1~~TRINITY_DN2523_c0_g1_i1.p1  ORF type:complete len:525 (-),score=80.79 TRINITY_DN2523_c0_g1_i1:473-2047(-)